MEMTKNTFYQLVKIDSLCNMKKFHPFKSVHPIEVIFEMPWKSILSLIVLTYISVLYDLIISFVNNKSSELNHLNDIFSTLLNTNDFLLWIFFIAFLINQLLNILYHYNVYKEHIAGSGFKILVKIFGYTGFFIIEIFYLIGFFCFSLMLVALITLEFQFLVSFFIFSFVFLGIAILIHRLYLSTKVNNL